MFYHIFQDITDITEQPIFLVQWIPFFLLLFIHFMLHDKAIPFMLFISTIVLSLLLNTTFQEIQLFPLQPCSVI